MCRRGHSEEYMRVRSDQSGSYCRWCESVNADRRRHGLPPLRPLESERRPLKRREFRKACIKMGLTHKLAIELSGHSSDCIGNYYRKGAGPEVRRDICRLLGVSESRIWQL